MFQFPWFPLAFARAWVLPRQVILLGYPRLGLLDSSPRLLAVLPRPSSATNAKASTLCPFLFDLHQPEHKTIYFLKCKIAWYIPSYSVYTKSKLAVNYESMFQPSILKYSSVGELLSTRQRVQLFSDAITYFL